ncbi:hypothetical protein ABZ860_41450 [Microbispora sp. NPDC046973]|uniref:hypothetical protein n=1 Tax=Microbispora sp. NPDC046973 TaxID=3155022 RepID=UPI0033DA787F
MQESPWQTITSRRDGAWSSHTSLMAAAMAMAPIPTPEVLWRKPPVGPLALITAIMFMSLTSQ